MFERLAEAVRPPRGRDNGRSFPATLAAVRCRLCAVRFVSGRNAGGGVISDLPVVLEGVLDVMAILKRRTLVPEGTEIEELEAD